ncbi:hypothetical protein [Periweissella cryptocerci]|nr:hypothetical protein [Periweissella cryptocerci]
MAAGLVLIAFLSGLYVADSNGARKMFNYTDEDWLDTELKPEN